MEYACSHGAQVIEGFPVEPRVDAEGNLRPATYRHMGYVSTFRKAGFREVVSPDKGRRIMRYIVSPGEERKHKSSRKTLPKAG